MQTNEPGEPFGVRQPQVEQNGIRAIAVGENFLGFLNRVRDLRLRVTPDHTHLIRSRAGD